MNLPKIVKELADIYIENITTELSEQVIGIYLYGSIPLGGYEEENSDIDFLTVLKNDCFDSDFLKINNIHQKLATVHPKANKMDGMYIPYSHLGKSNKDLQPYPFVHSGKVQMGYWDINHVTWWSIKTVGITLYGVEGRELPIYTKWADIVSTMDYNLNVYWKNRVSRIGGTTLLEPEDVADAVLTLCRIHYTLTQKQFLPKTKAGKQFVSDYGQNPWVDLVQEAIKYRENINSPSLFLNKIVKAERIVQFIEYMIHIHSKEVQW